jgi:undecaprenyl-diphosphatase
MYELFVAVLAGLVQGMAEFIPISSSAHLYLFSHLVTGGKDLGILATNVISLGTTIALIQYFWQDIVGYLMRIKNICVNHTDRAEFARNLRGKTDSIHWSSDVTIVGSMIATVPISVVYILFSKTVEHTLRTPFFIGVGFIIGALFLAAAEFYYNTVLKREAAHRPFGLVQFLVLGVFQTLSLLPGMSRSGSTMIGGFLTGRDRPTIIRNVFFISVPAFILAGLVSILKIFTTAEKVSFLPQNELTISQDVILFSVSSLLISTLVAYISGLLVLRWLLTFLTRQSNAIFIGYRIVVGVVVLTAAFLGW